VSKFAILNKVNGLQLFSASCQFYRYDPQKGLKVTPKFPLAVSDDKGQGSDEDQQFFVGAEAPTCISKNRYDPRAHISGRKFRQLGRFFAPDISAADTPLLTALKHRICTLIFLKIRQRIAEERERATPLSGGDVVVNESYFGAC